MLIVALRGVVSEIYRPFFKIAILGHESWLLAKVANALQGVEIQLIFAHGQRFPSYGPIFKIALLGYKTWPLYSLYISEASRRIRW